jgi:hypothetical protein
VVVARIPRHTYFLPRISMSYIFCTCCNSRLTRNLCCRWCRTGLLWLLIRRGGCSLSTTTSEYLTRAFSCFLRLLILGYYNTNIL